MERVVHFVFLKLFSFVFYFSLCSSWLSFWQLSISLSLFYIRKFSTLQLYYFYSDLMLKILDFVFKIYSSKHVNVGSPLQFLLLSQGEVKKRRVERKLFSWTAFQKIRLYALKVLVLFQESNVLIAANSQGTIKVSYFIHLNIKLGSVFRL